MKTGNKGTRDLGCSDVLIDNAASLLVACCKTGVWDLRSHKISHNMCLTQELGSTEPDSPW